MDNAGNYRYGDTKRITPWNKEAKRAFADPEELQQASQTVAPATPEEGRARVLGAVGDKPVSVPELQSRTGMTATDIRGVLHESREIVHVEADTYRRLSAEEQAATGEAAGGGQAAEPARYEGRTLQEHQDAYNRRQEAYRQAQIAARGEPGGIGPLHQAEEQAGKSARAAGMRLSAAKRALGGGTGEASAQVSPERQAQGLEALTELPAGPFRERAAAEATAEETAAKVQELKDRGRQRQQALRRKLAEVQAQEQEVSRDRGLRPSVRAAEVRHLEAERQAAEEDLAAWEEVAPPPTEAPPVTEEAGGNLVQTAEQARAAAAVLATRRGRGKAAAGAGETPALPEAAAPGFSISSPTCWPGASYPKKTMSIRPSTLF